MARKNHLIVDSGCTLDNERWSLSACGLNEDSEVSWDGTHKRDLVSCKRCQAKMSKPKPAPEPFHKERPILFNSAMVRAILSGQKTVTRRPIKGNQVPSRSKSDSPEHQWIAVVQDHPRWGFAAFGATEEECAAELAMYGGCPYGRHGDRLWVRETWGVISHTWNEHGDMVDWVPDRPATAIRELPFGRGYYSGHVIYAADGPNEWAGDDDGGGEPRSAWHPSIHMPRAASRILLEITDVRVERLQDISEEQARAEGIVGVPFRPDDGFPICTGYMVGPDDGKSVLETTAAKAFAKLWQSTGGDWDTNPWVWVVEFRRVQP